MAPSDLLPTDPPDLYREWYRQAERCSGLTGDFDQVTWLIGGEPHPEGEDRIAAGQWIRPRTIWISRPYRDVQWVVMHEVLHELRQRGGHPANPFETCRVTQATHQ